MNAQEVKGNWKQLKGKVKAKWGKLTDDDLIKAEGKADILAGRLQEHYGKSKDDARKSVDDFFDSL